jgi:hypothetical protein
MSSGTKSAKTTAVSGPTRGYKRSWKNLLINKRYQLRFTLFMAGLAAVLIAALGYFVMFYADRTTTIGINRVISEPCPEVPTIETEVAAPTPTPTPDQPDDQPPPDTGSGSGGGGKVIIGEMSMQTCDDPDPAKRPEDCPAYVPPAPPKPPKPAVPPDFADAAAQKWACEMRHKGAVAGLHDGRTRILLVLIASGIVLVLGLSIYGIKMTHRVAGPLYKVQLYLAKMRDGRLDKVYNLRKGDQLVAFYEHFKAGHAGVVSMEQADIARLKAILAVVDKDPAKFETPELAERVAELRSMLARKEKSLE